MRTTVVVVEREGLLHEQINFREGNARIPKGEGDEPLLLDPTRALRRIRKRGQRHGSARPKSLTPEHVHDAPSVLGIERDHQVDVRGEAWMSMDDDREAPNDQVANVLRVERSEDTEVLHATKCSTRRNYFSRRTKTLVP